MKLFTLCLCFALMGESPSGLARENLGLSNPPLGTRDVFAKVKPTLTKRTQVPLRLPTFLPDDGDKDNPIYAILESADRYGYEIQLAWDENCTGGNYCHYGTVQGSVNPVAENGGKKISVTLERGVKGNFVSFACGAHCDDSSIEWKEDGYYYSVSIKAEKLKNLIRVANSAILSKSEVTKFDLRTTLQTPRE